MKSLTGTQKLHHVTGLYLEGIRDGKIWEALNAHTGERYTQHSTGVEDGQKGFAAFFGPFVERNPIREISIIRAIEDGPYVFVHVFQSLNNGESQWVTADLFDTDPNDRVIEHWDVIQAFIPAPEPDHSMINGPVDIDDLDRTETNKRIVQRFSETVLIERRYEAAEDYVSGDQLVQHNPEIADGVCALQAYLAADNPPIRYWKVHRLIGQGNFVVTLSHVQKGQSHYCVFDIYRLKQGKIVEHWDVMEKILAPEDWNNQGKF